MKHLVGKRLVARAVAAGMIVAGATLAASPSWAAKESLILAVVLEPPHLDPTAGAAAAIDEVVYANIFEGLTRIDRNGEVKPALAESWSGQRRRPDLYLQAAPGREVSRRHGLRLRRCEVLARPRHGGGQHQCAERPVRADRRGGDTGCAQTVVITLKSAAGNFLFNLGWGDAVIVAPETAETNKSEPVGTGPFVLQRWTKGDRIELLRNPNYWGTPAKLAAATIKIIPDPAAATAALLAGDVDAFPNFPAPEALGQFEGDARYTVVIGSTEGETILAMNNGRKPLNDHPRAPGVGLRGQSPGRGRRRHVRLRHADRQPLSPRTTLPMSISPPATRRTARRPCHC